MCESMHFQSETNIIMLCCAVTRVILQTIKCGKQTALLIVSMSIKYNEMGQHLLTFADNDKIIAFTDDNAE